MRIAHITDLHLVEPEYQRRRAGARFRLQFLNTGRSIDAATRCRRVVQALRFASAADHVLLTGDLTDDGAPAQFETLAEVLAEAGVSPERVTLVPGNHDFYTSQDAFARALDGPLRCYAPTSRPDRGLDFGRTVILPIATTKRQPLPLSAGTLPLAQAQTIAALASDCGRRSRTLVLAQHHPPLGYRNPIWNWIDGMDSVARFLELLSDHETLHVVHGHTHRRVSSAIRVGRAPQIHAGAAVFDDPLHVRFYHADEGGFAPVEAARMPERSWGDDRNARATSARTPRAPATFAEPGAATL